MTLEDFWDAMDQFNDTEEIFIKDEDGTLYDIEVERQDEIFDGFETAYPPAIILTKKQ